MSAGPGAEEGYEREISTIMSFLSFRPLDPACVRMGTSSLFVSSFLGGPSHGGFAFVPLPSTFPVAPRDRADDAVAAVTYVGHENHQANSQTLKTKLSILLWSSGEQCFSRFASW